MSLVAILGITSSLALPELAAWCSGCVAVVGGGSEGFLFLVMSDQADFDEEGEEEDEAGLVSLNRVEWRVRGLRCDYCDCEGCTLDLACMA